MAGHWSKRNGRKGTPQALQSLRPRHPTAAAAESDPKGYTVRTKKGTRSEPKRVYGFGSKGYTL